MNKPAVLHVRAPGSQTRTRCGHLVLTHPTTVSWAYPSRVCVRCQADIDKEKAFREASTRKTPFAMSPIKLLTCERCGTCIEHLGYGKPHLCPHGVRCDDPKMPHAVVCPECRKAWSRHISVTDELGHLQKLGAFASLSKEVIEALMTLAGSYDQIRKSALLQASNMGRCEDCCFWRIPQKECSLLSTANEMPVKTHADFGCTNFDHR